MTWSYITCVYFLLETRRDERYRSGARVCLSVCTCVTGVALAWRSVCRDLHGGGGEVFERKREGESVCGSVCVRRCVCT